jgi:glycosidase
MTSLQQKLNAHLAFIYGEKNAQQLTELLLKQLAEYKSQHPELSNPASKRRISEKDAILITYGDMVKREGEAPLKTLSHFLKKYFSDVISTVHILPFYPYSSDDGFSVIDYRQVDPTLGTWDDVDALGKDFRLMFDAVVNHISAGSAEFQGFLKGEKKYDNFFTSVDAEADTSKVFRPRSSPLLTPFETSKGEKHIWTTFSADQIDLNYANPAVLFEVVDILLFYVAHGAEFIRLDAVTYLWKDLETSSANLPQTHRIIQLIRTVLDEVAPNVAIITETNVPHKDNIAYFGNGYNEAQMVYNFALSPLVLYTFYSGNAQKLTEWAQTLELPSDRATFFNFLASHDGIGVTPVRDILTPEQISTTVERTQKLGGRVGYKANGDGTQSAYELNINYLSALGDPAQPNEPVVSVAKRFLAAQAIMLALRGVPGIYIHSLIGSENWQDGVAQTGHNRTINRQKLPLATLETELETDAPLRKRVYQGYHHLLDVRQNHAAFHPFGGQKVLDVDAALFALTRTSPDETEHLLCLHNITAKAQRIALNLNLLPFNKVDALIDLITAKTIPVQNATLELTLEPYDVLWLTAAL